MFKAQIALSLRVLKKIGRKPFALSLSKGCSWFDKPVLSRAEGLTTNGVLNIGWQEYVWCGETHR
jgi:hypothetical protein